MKDLKQKLHIVKTPFALEKSSVTEFSFRFPFLI